MSKELEELLIKSVKKIGWKYYRMMKLESALSQEDFEQECYLYYLRFYNKFQEGKGFTFNTHVGLCCKGCAVRLAKMYYQTKERIPPLSYDYNNYYITSEGDEEDRFNFIPSIELEFANTEYNNDLYELLKDFSDEEREVINMFVEGFTLNEINLILRGTLRNGIAQRTIKKFKKKYDKLMNNM